MARIPISAALLLNSTLIIMSGACGVQSEGQTNRQIPMPEDSVALAGRILYGLVQSLDEYGRRAGVLPSELTVVSGSSSQPLDPWGNLLHYYKSGLRFELRSSGPDEKIDTIDDVIVTGHVGRNRPCELRNELQVERWEEFAPLCELDKPVVVFPLCPALIQTAVEVSTILVSEDSVRAAGNQLVGLARRIDGVSRTVGGPIPTLRPVPGSEPIAGEWRIKDIWGNKISYDHTAEAFELRSAGSDGILQTFDDITVAGDLARTIPCKFYVGDEIVTCDDPPPACPVEPDVQTQS